MNFHNPLLSGSFITGTRVENLNGDHIGLIKDIMINTHSGEIAYAVLSVDTGFLNLNSKFFAIPLQALEFDPENQRILLDIMRERLETAPGFDKENYPSGPQSEFIGSVYDFYEVERSEGNSAEIQTNRTSISGNAATRQSSGGFKSEASDFRSEKSYDYKSIGYYNKSIH